MNKALRAFLIITLLLSVSIVVMILPSFSTKGISRIQTNKNIELELILNGTKDIELIFFGYAGCQDVCTPRLEALSKLYYALPLPLQKHLGVKFLDLSHPNDKDLPDTFAKFFHTDFEGIFLQSNVLRLYTKSFSVYFANSLTDSTQIDHTSHLYLVKRSENRKELRFIYSSFPYDFKQIQDDIKELINE